MQKLVLALALSALVASGGFISRSFAETIPCEKMLSDVKAAVESAKLSEADKAKVTDLEDKGLERCKADDDARADALFAQALKILGK